MDDFRVKIKEVDMPKKLQKDAVKITKAALEKYRIEKSIAQFIKKEFDKKYEKSWHCIVGKSFGSYVTHSKGGFVYFYVDDIAILLFKS